MTERTRRTQTVAILWAIGTMAWGTLGFAQTPPPKPKPKTSPQQTQSKRAAATLLVVADEACDLAVNGKPVGRLQAGATKVVSLEILGDQLVQARATDGLTWSRTLSIEKPGQEIVETGFKALRAQAVAEAQKEQRRQDEIQKARAEQQAQEARAAQAIRSLSGTWQTDEMEEDARQDWCEVPIITRRTYTFDAAGGGTYRLRLQCGPRSTFTELYSVTVTNRAGSNAFEIRHTSGRCVDAYLTRCSWAETEDFTRTLFSRSDVILHDEKGTRYTKR